LAQAGPRLRTVDPWTSLPPVLAAAAILGITVARKERARPGGLWFGRAAWGCAVGLTAAAILFRSPSLAVAAFLTTVIAVVDGAGGAGVRRAVLLAWVCVWLSIPFSFGGDRLAEAAQAVAVRQASAALDLADVRHRVVAGGIEIPGRVFPTPRLDETLFTSLAAVCLMGVALRRGPVWMAALLSTAAIWSFAFLVLSAALPVFFGARGGGPDVSEWPSWWPTAAGAAFAVLLAWGTDRGLSWLMPHGGETTWRMMQALLSGGSHVDDEAWPAEEVVSDRAPVSRIRAIVLTAVFAATAALWFLPPVGSPVSDARGGEGGARFYLKASGSAKPQAAEGSELRAGGVRIRQAELGRQGDTNADG